MKKSDTKQLLSPLDEPNNIPAAGDFDFSHAVSSFKPGNYEIDDLPKRIPIFNPKTGKIQRFVRNRREIPARRAVSMPVPSTSSSGSFPSAFSKELPSPPISEADNESGSSSANSLLSEYRVISMYTHPTSSIDKYHESLPPLHPLPPLPSSQDSEDVSSESSLIYSDHKTTYSMKISSPFKAKNVITDDDESLFSELSHSSRTDTSSDLSEHSDSPSLIARSIMYVVHEYSSATNSEVSLATTGQNIPVDDYYWMDDLPDSLFSNNAVEEEPREKMITPSNTKKLLEPIKIAATPMPHKNKPLPLPLPMQKSRKGMDRRVQNNSKECSSSFISLKSGESSFTEAKHGLAAYVRQNPFNYSLDGPKQYKLSRFPSTAVPKKKRVQSAYSTSTQKSTEMTPSSKPRTVSMYSVPYPTSKNPIPPVVSSKQVVTPKGVSGTSFQKPRKISEGKTRNSALPSLPVYPTSREGEKEEMIKNHVLSFLLKMKQMKKEQGGGAVKRQGRAPSSSSKNLPQVPEIERDNRFRRNAQGMRW